ncbi:hypothetical protein FRC11_003242 [Ceratobasidium sp. 423]|nr:hypothetical protein FRC11_003242 [Ceratobasidium sp. 423]
MSLPWDPRWGRPVGSYAPSSDIFRISVSVDDEIAGLQAMQKISQLATEARIPGQPNPEKDTDISTLNSALRLSLDPATIRHVANPLAASGCIQLMQTITGQNPGIASVSIFNLAYELGWLCFKLLVVCLDICLLDRWNNLDPLLEIADKDERTAPHGVISANLPIVVRGEFDALNPGGNRDWLLGWSVDPNRPRRTSLLSRSDISALLDLLWHDRKFFLKALTSHAPSRLPGLSGLFFLLSRYVAHEHETQQNSHRNILRNRVYELGVRYALTADKYQRPATPYILQATCVGMPDTLKHVDLEDSRLIMTAFIQMMTISSSSDLIQSPELAHILQFIPLATDAGSQNLLPEIIQCIVDYGWSMLLDLESKGKRIGAVVENLCVSLVLSTQRQIVETLYTSDVVDWAARVIATLNPIDSAAADGEFSFYMSSDS